jgi:HD-like signal output (HDOD) protein
MNQPGQTAKKPFACVTQAFADLSVWTRFLRDAEIPVMAATAVEIEKLRESEKDVSVTMLAEVIESDPLMMLKLMAYVASRRRPGVTTETETVTSSLVLIGVPPFFNSFGPQPTLEDRLADQPAALEGLQALLKRAQRSSRFALGFAVHRRDPDADVICQAAFLYDFAEMLLWCHAPDLVLRIHAAQAADPALRSAQIQRAVLHVEIDDLRQELLKLWRMPELLVRICDGRHPDLPAVRNVVLAARLARHTSHGWDNAALPDDISDIAVLLNASPRVVLPFVRKIDLSG